LQYRIPVKTPAEQAKTVATLQSAAFADFFGQQVISAERSRQKGLPISQLNFVRLSASSESFFAGLEGNASQSLQREAVGQTLDVFGNPEWGNSTLASWAGNATPAIQSALVRTLSTPGIPESLQ